MDEEKIEARHQVPKFPPCPGPRYQHHRVQSTPIVMERHHSAPSFVNNQWGNEKTRRSYRCLTALNSHVRCFRRRRCTSCAKLPDTFSRQTKGREWWGMFVDLDEYDHIGSVGDGSRYVGANERTTAKTKVATNRRKKHRHDNRMVTNNKENDLTTYSDLTSSPSSASEG